ncbi:hypothetical protein KUV95_00030 [Microbulbifer agarilyticus]|uniref:hypothetical protein n=1 Tax=Microbulbifer agarilyticus TaxID=260552 RepID=UPI001C986613|nr:hypothetical protein [Microbulbifer agarilyticus]MBY6209930.1 hypothetical protein [Microbulbifer agarilyticus]
MAPNIVMKLAAIHIAPYSQQVGGHRGQSVNFFHYMKWLPVVTVLVLMQGCGGGSGLPRGSNVLVFDSALWQSEESVVDFDEDLISSRQKMLDDLVRHVLPGKCGDEIPLLLGAPVDIRRAGKSYDFIYYMGPQRDSFFPVDSEWLLIWLGEDGCFERYEIYTD